MFDCMVKNVIKTSSDFAKSSDGRRLRLVIKLFQESACKAYDKVKPDILAAINSNPGKITVGLLVFGAGIRVASPLIDKLFEQREKELELEHERKMYKAKCDFELKLQQLAKEADHE